MNYDNLTYLDSFGLKHIPQEISKLIDSKKYHKKAFIEHKQTIQLCVDTFGFVY